MADVADSYPVGQAPWEAEGSTDPHADSFPVGQAPWEKQPEQSMLDANLPFGYTPRSLIRGALDTLPSAGMIVGGLVGTPADVISGPTGTMVGAGLGAAAGEALKNAGKTLIGEGPETMSDVVVDPAKAFIEGAGSEGTGMVMGKGLDALSQTKIARKTMSKAGGAANWLASNLSGIPTSEIRAYAKDPTGVRNLAIAADGDQQEMADQFRQRAKAAIAARRGQLNGQISQALKSSSPQKNIDVTPIIQHLESSKASIDPSLNPEALKDIDGLISRIKGTAPLDTPAAPISYQANTEMASSPIDTSQIGGPSQSGHYMHPPVPGTPNEMTPVINDSEDRIISLPVGGAESPKFAANLKGVHDITKFLQSQADGAYGASPLGFQVGDQAARAAGGAAGVSRGILEPLSPDIAQANAGLQRLHAIENVMNRNLLQEGKTGSSIFSAGSGQNGANAKVLRQLGQETGQDIAGDATNVAAARTFGSPGLTPVDSTGKSLTRMGMAGLLGGAAGYAADGREGAVMGALGAEGLASPAAIRLAIDSGLGAKAFGGAAVSQIPSLFSDQLTSEIPSVSKLMPSGGGITSLIKAAQQNPNLLNGIKNDALRDKLQNAASADNSPDDQMKQAAMDLLKKPIDDQTARQHYLNGN